MRMTTSSKRTLKLIAVNFVGEGTFDPVLISAWSRGAAQFGGVFLLHEIPWKGLKSRDQGPEFHGNT